MKKIMFFAFTTILILISFDFVKAYENSIYKIDIPDSYIKEKDNDIWKYNIEDNTTTISINVTDNKENINFENYNDNSINKDEYNKQIQEHLKEQYGDVEIKSSDIILTKINKHNSIKISVVSSYVDSGKYNSVVYQSQYILSSKKYIYNITVSSSDGNEINSNTVSNIINSFEFKDKAQKKDMTMVKFYLSISILFALCLLFIALHKKKTNKK